MIDLLDLLKENQYIKKKIMEEDIPATVENHDENSTEKAHGKLTIT